ncbi:hypothetical protein AL485_24925 [Serratia liquefaciens]|nr:hypothetical protein AL485_24925 [Serratia liquefaciens]
MKTLAGKLNQTCNPQLPVILEAASVLAALQDPSVGLAPSGPLQAAFKSVPDRFVAHPSHLAD